MRVICSTFTTKRIPNSYQFFESPSRRPTTKAPCPSWRLLSATMVPATPRLGTKRVFHIQILLLFTANVHSFAGNSDPSLYVLTQAFTHPPISHAKASIQLRSQY